MAAWDAVNGRIADAYEIVELGDEGLIAELDNELTSLTDAIDTLELEVLFTHEHDSKPAVVSIVAETDETEVQEWVYMLQWMLVNFCKQHALKVNWIGESGVQHTRSELVAFSVTFSVTGDHPYGWLKSEDGVHQLVRISTFDAAGKRPTPSTTNFNTPQQRTSFARVNVYPDIADAINIQISHEDLDEQRCLPHPRNRRGGTDAPLGWRNGYQVQHIPTGMFVSCYSYRSRKQNEKMAMKILKLRLHRLEQGKQQAERLVLKGDKIDVWWANTIRSYVLHPYKMVKDLRTGYELSDPTKVLDGDLAPFIKVYLRYQLGENDE